VSRAGVALALLLGACSGSAFRPEALREAAERIDRDLAQFRKLEAGLDASPESPRFTAYFQGKLLHRVDQRIAYPDGGAGEASYYYSSYGLFHYRLKRTITRMQNGTPAGQDRVEISLFLDPRGEPVALEKKVNGQPAALDGLDVMNAKNQASLLRARAIDLSGK
jgi:hypothetical protein